MSKTRLKDGPQVGVHFRLPPATLSQVKVTASAVGLRPSDLYRFGAEAALAAFSASLSASSPPSADQKGL